MNERTRDILQLLIKDPAIKAAAIAETLNLTRRQINYAIQLFNEELQENQLPTIKRDRSGSFEIPIEVMHFVANQKEENTGILMENERAILLIAALITNVDYVSLNHFTELLEVSKNTVLEDIKSADWLVEKYQLTINYDRLHGYRLKGEERRILQLLSDILKQHPLLQKVQYQEQLLHPNVRQKDVIHLIHEVESKLGISYSDESIDYLQTSIRYLITRGLQPGISSINFFEDQVKGMFEYQVINNCLKEFEWTLSQSYLEWLTILFLASNVYENSNIEQSKEDRQLARLITKMVSQFEEQTFIQIDDRQIFEKRLLGHLRPACFRIRYGLSLGIYSLESLVKDSNHAILIEMLKEIVQPIEQWLGKSFPNDELELLSYYFGSQLSVSNEKTTKPRAVVVCTNGVIVSRLMIEALRKLFPELHFLAAFSVREFYRFQADYEVVFTTVPLKTELHQYILNPIMNYKEQVSLRYRVLKELGINETEQMIDQLLQIIQKSAMITDRKQLKEELQTFLVVQQEAAPLENFQILPSLISYIKPEYIQTVDKELTWEEAVDLACQPLLADGVVNHEFTADLKKQIVSPSFYSYLGTKISIPHTTADHGILKDGVSFLVLKKPIRFPDGQEINFLVPLAFHDLTKHLRAINQLANLSENKTLLTALLKGKEANDVYHILKSQY